MRRLPISITAILYSSLLTTAQAADTLTDRQLHDIVATYAGSAVDGRQAVGIGVAIVRPGHAPLFSTFGKSAVHPDRAFDVHQPFIIGSVTKIFTTNLQAQDSLLGTLKLDTKLGELNDRLALPPGSVLADATLADLGSFTAGLPNLPPVCDDTNPPPCMPNGRPTLQQYGAPDLLGYLQSATFNAPPAGYLYSDLSTGLLGLLLASKPGQLLANNDLHRWYKAIQAAILAPLNLGETTLTYGAARPDAIRGYQIPLFRTSITGGVVSTRLLNNVDGGLAAGPYFDRPQATLEGGGGTGAKVTLTWSTPSQNGAAYITGVKVDNTASTGYVDSIALAIADAPQGAEAPVLEPIVKAGRIVGVQIVHPGAKFTNGLNQTVTITGGYPTGQGTNAQAVAEVVDGHIAFIRVLDGGSGYVTPAYVKVRPGRAFHFDVPIWGAAGSLKSSLSDMATLAQAALPTRGNTQLIGRAFKVAQSPRACEDGVSSLAECPAGIGRVGLAWDVMAASTAPAFPKLVSKDGGLNGYSTVVAMMPGQQLGAVVFINDLQDQPPIDGSNAEPPKAGLTAPQLAQNILSAIYFAEHP